MNKTTEQNWEYFWKNSPNQFNDIMYLSTGYFAVRLKQEHLIEKTDKILDIGCGLGFLIQAIKNDCTKIIGTDISEIYINQLKKIVENDKHIALTLSKPYDFEAYRQLISAHKINKIIILSVLQYYENETKVLELINSLKKESDNHKFSCLIADIIPTKHSTITDIKDMAVYAFKKRHLFKLIKFLFYAVFSNYRKIKKAGMLSIDASFFKLLEGKLGIEVEIIKNLTLHSGRYSVLINF